MDKLPPLRFAQSEDRDFHRAIMGDAQSYLAERNDHRFADRNMILRTGFILALSIVFYLLSLMQAHALAFAGSYFVFIMLSMLLNITAHHDASHNVFFKRAWANRLLSRVATLPMGVDPDYWRVRHAEFHHLYANVEHYDLDTEENGFLRQSPFQRHWSYMRYQHLYWPLIAALSLPYIAWVFDWSDRLGKTPLVNKSVLKGKKGWGIFLGSKILHFTLVLIVPIWVCGANGIGWGTVLLIYFFSQMLSSLIVVVLILGTHWAEAKFYDVPESGTLSHGWYHHNFATSCDWHTSPDFLYYFLGGLNLHLTHHLFPNWNHRHYRALAKIIEKRAVEYGMPYRCVSYTELFKLQQAFLKSMGRGDTYHSEP